MRKLYLVTGAAGHVGTVLVQKLLDAGENVRALVYINKRITIRDHTDNLEVFWGDIRDKKSLEAFFDRTGYDSVTVIHCAALITIATKTDPVVWETNVGGTENVMALSQACGAERVIYVSSVHAIPERPDPETITEVDSFSPDLVHGQYARSKAAAAQVALEYAGKGMNVSIVHPSGIIGPGDTLRQNHMIRTIHAMAAGIIPVGLPGGYDFVDARDVADGILGCEKQGRSGECYLLTGHYISVLDLVNMVRTQTGKRPTSVVLPYGFVKAVAPAAEKAAALFGGGPPLLTPYSVHTVNSNGHFSYAKAQREFGYRPRPLEDSVRDSLPGSAFYAEMGRG